MTEKDDHPSTSHIQFPYYFSDVDGINFTALPIGIHGDLLIYYSSMVNPYFIDCWCTRWDQTDWTLVIETFLEKDDIQLLLDNSLPGAVGELWYILGSKVHYDKSWEGRNTIKFVPTSSNRYRSITQSFEGYNKSNLVNMRDDTIVYVKNIITNPIEGDSGIMNVKIEAVKSGGTI